jgi:L-rhamnose 1-dehydrogenase
MFDFLIGANLKSNFLVMRAALLALRRQGGGGSVVVVSSINATIGLPDQAVYTAAKAAVNSLVTAAAVEGGPYGTRVNAIAPGLTRTRGMSPRAGDDPAENRAIPLGRVGQPIDMVGPVRFLLSDESAYVTGSVLSVDGGLMHLRPPLIDEDREH